ncbi:MAG: hypothetical protein AAF226_02980 [Verrucomicrobiota bacterium]
MKNEVPDVSELQRQMDASVQEDGGWYPGCEEAVAVGNAAAGMAAFEVRTPLTELLKEELVHEDERTVADFVWCAMLMIRLAIGDGQRKPSLLEIGKKIALWAQDAGLEPFASMTQQAIADMTETVCPHCGEVVERAQTRASVCATHKNVVQAPKEEAGGRAVLTKGQKPLHLREDYAKGAKGNKNRARSVTKKRVRAHLKQPEI